MNFCFLPWVTSSLLGMVLGIESLDRAHCIAGFLDSTLPKKEILIKKNP